MSAISVVQTIQAATSTNATSHATASLAPGAAGNFLLLACHHSNLTAATAMDAPTGACLSNVAFVNSIAIDATRRMDIWTGITSASTSAVTFNFNETSDATVWSVVEFANVDLTRGVNNTIGGIAANLPQNAGVGTAASMTAKAVQHASNAMVAIYYSNAIGIGNNPEAGWTELSGNSTSSPAVGLHVDWRIGTDTTPTSTYASSVTWGALGLELWGEDGNGDWNCVETFTKADGIGWGDDQTWASVAVQGVPVVFSNQAGSSGANVYASSLLANDSSSSNHEGRILAAVMPLSGQAVIGIRLRGHSTDGASYEFIRVGATSLGAYTVLLRYRNASGVYTTLAGPLTVARTAVDTAENLYFTAVGSILTCFLNGVQVLAVTNTTLGTSRNRGGLVIRGSATSDTLADNFQLGDIGQTNFPKELAGTSDLGRNSAKAQHYVRKINTGKSGTANQAFAVLSSRIARMRARLGSATSARAAGFATQVEGFTVIRPLIVKAQASSKVTAALTTQQKIFNTNIPITSAGGGVFNPAVLDVNKGQLGAEFPIVISAFAQQDRLVGFEATAFQSDAINVHMAGGFTQLATTVPTASGLSVHTTVQFEATIPIVANVTAIEWMYPAGVGGIFTPPYFLEGHTTLVQRQYADKLFRHYRARPEGHNVYIYSDGTVSESDPDSYSTMWRESDRTQQTLVDAATVVRIFWGGHEGEPVSPEEAALLTAAGYTVRGYHPQDA